MSTSLPPADGDRFFPAGQPPLQPPGLPQPPPAEPAPTPPPLDPLTAQVLLQLDAAPPTRTWLSSLLWLGATIVLFAVSGIFNNSVADLALLIGILFIHEMGHYLGMLLFNYQDVRMFFIPLFGAAVSGKRTSVEAYQEAIVLLLGPLPGILLGCALGVVCIFVDSELLRSATLQLLVLNGFNLLPFLPLDGGRLLHVVLFSRQRHLEAFFQLGTGILVALLGFLMRAWVLSGVGILMALNTRTTFNVNTLATRLRSAVLPDNVERATRDLTQPIPHEFAVPLIESVQRTFPQFKQPKVLANLVRQVWERMHGRPPGLFATLLILLAYVSGFLALIAVPLVVALAPQTTVVTTNNGRTQVVRVFGRIQKQTELNAAGKPHGHYVEFYRGTDKIHFEGEYADGLKDGKWTEHDRQGQPIRVTFYQQGRPVQPPPVPGK